MLLGRKKKEMRMMVRVEKVEKVEWMGEGSRWTKSTPATPTCGPSLQGCAIPAEQPTH